MERRLLQAAVALGSLSPIGFGLAGVLFGPAFVAPDGSASATDFDSHFRFLSGIFLALGLVFLSTVPAIERRTTVFRAAGLTIVTGGLARLLSLLMVGLPTAPHLVGLGAELVLMPVLLLWQARVARRAGAH